VLAASDSDSDQGSKALERLCQTYWRPLYAYIRRSGHTIEAARDLTQVWVGEGVIADLVPLVDDPPQQLGVRLALGANDEERGRHAFAAKRVEDLRGPARIRTVVEGQGDLSLSITRAANDERRGKAEVLLLLDLPVLGIDLYLTLAIARPAIT
jgi:hypothetical protein